MVCRPPRSDVVALVLHAILTTDQFGSWGWRVAFAPAVVLAALSFVLRLRLPESRVYAELRESGRVSRRPFVDLFRTRAGRWVVCMLMIGMVSAGFFLTVSYPVIFVALEDKFSQTGPSRSEASGWRSSASCLPPRPSPSTGASTKAWFVSAFRARHTGAATTANGVALASFGVPSVWLAGVLVRDHGYLAPGFLLVAAGIIGSVTALLLPR